MGFDAVFLKVLWEKDVKLDPIYLVYEVKTCNDIYHATALLSEITTDMKAQFGDKYAGVVTMEKLASLQIGEYALTVESTGTHYNIWRVENKVVEGWFVNGAETTPVKIGYYAYTTPLNGVHTDGENKAAAAEQMFKESTEKIDELTKQVAMYKLKYESEQNRGDRLSNELINTENLLDDSRKSTVMRADECRKMMAEVEKFRRNADKDLTTLQELTTELSDLKRQLYEKDREIATLREEAMYAHRGGSTPMKTSTVQATPEYDEVIARIKAFDKTRLLSRKERDQLLREKNRMK